MDFRITQRKTIRRMVSRENSRRMLADHAPRAEALAATCIERARPLAETLFALRRRIATTTVAVLAGLLFVHVMFGANGMVVYKQKRADYESLQKRILQEKKEAEIYRQQIQAMKTDGKAIEKEAREQLRYVRPGEYVYVPPPAVNPAPQNGSAKN